jgi:putative ABC transport system ATP-binding protein
LLRAAGVSKHYTDGNVRALRDVSLEIEAGQYLSIMGPSGCGKSTLLNILGGLDRPTAGEVFFREQPLSRLASLDRFRSEQLGFVFQSFHLLPTLTSEQNVQIPMFESSLPPSERTHRARHLLELVDMTHRRRHLPYQLSVGERQRVAIARALANEPVLLLADEPTGNLDSATAAGILDLFDRLHQHQQMTLLLVTHDAQVASRTQRVISMQDGKIVSVQDSALDRGMA